MKDSRFIIETRDDFANRLWKANHRMETAKASGGRQPPGFSELFLHCMRADELFTAQNREADASRSPTKKAREPGFAGLGWC